MSHFPETKKVHSNSDDPNVIQLGFNISVAGNSASDFEIFVNDKKQACGQLSDAGLQQLTSADIPEIQNMTSSMNSTGGNFTGRSSLDITSETNAIQDHAHCRKRLSAEMEDGRKEEKTIIDEIRDAMGNFEKFSEHLKEIPRLSTKRCYTSTPYPNKTNSRSEGNLTLYGQAPRLYVPKHNFRDRKYIRKPRPLSSDLFLKPLPAEDYFKKGFVRRYCDIESFSHYTSMDSIPQCYEYGGEFRSGGQGAIKSDNDKSDALSSASDACISEPKASKKEGNETIDKQSTSSESAKDIKIYQSGGIIIMHNYNENADLIEKKESLDESKMIENCTKLKEKVESCFQSSDESQRLLLNSSSDDVKGQGKSVQFDLSSCENMKMRSSDTARQEFTRETSDAKNDSNRDIPLLLPQNQDFTSLSTQENDSIISNLLGMSPTSSTSGKKLEWDSGADVGYLNMDLSKENISTIERIILKGLSDDGVSKKEVVYQRTEQEPSKHPLKYIVERMSSELGIVQVANENPQRSISDQSSLASRIMKSTGSSQSDETSGHISRTNETGGIKSREVSQIDSIKKINRTNHLTKNSVSAESYQSKSSRKFELLKKQKDSTSEFKEKCVQTHSIEGDTALSDKSTFVNTLFCEPCFDLPLQNLTRSDESGRSESSERFQTLFGVSPRIKKLTKKRNSQSNLTARLKDKIDTIIDIARQSNRSDERRESVCDGISVQTDGNAHQSHVSNPSSACSSVKQTKDHVIQSRPISGSSSSIRTVMHNTEVAKVAKSKQAPKQFSDQIMQTCELERESKAIQAFFSSNCSAASSQRKEIKKVDDVSIEIRRSIKHVPACSKSIQAPGMNTSLPKHLAHPKKTDQLEQLNTKSTQFFGGPITSLPNYHYSVNAKETNKVLKNKIHSNAENRIKQENVKNASLKITREIIRNPNGNNDDGKSNTNVTCRSSNDPENKENHSADNGELTDKEKQSKKDSREGHFAHSDSVGFGSCEVLLSDDDKNVVLTSEMLKEHGDSIDRNIIQEKYFQSQLRELEWQEMVTKGTSTVKKKEHEQETQTTLKTVVSVSCQYSPDFASRNKAFQNETETGNACEVTAPLNVWLNGATEKGDSEPNTAYVRKLRTLNNSTENFVLVESSSRSSDTPHSWGQGIQGNELNSAVGRALSFEYLPGHIYESSSNLKEGSLSETEKNINLEDSVGANVSDSNSQSGTQGKKSEDGQTIVLENTDRSALDSDQMKTLDNNLTDLEVVVSKLHEKEAIFQKITDTVLSTISKANGSGDTSASTEESKTNVNSQGTEEICCEFDIIEESSKSNGSKPGTQEKSHSSMKETSTACQTDTIEPDRTPFNDERKKLEQRTNGEKGQQIKWIENEIKHLNMLRSLLEEREDSKNSTLRRKRNHYLTEANGNPYDSMKEDLLKSLSQSMKTVTAISDEHLKPVNFISKDLVTKTVKELSESEPHAGQFGMTLSLRRGNKIQQVTMLPVGVQVTLRGSRNSSGSGGRKNDPASEGVSVSPSGQNPHAVSSDFTRQVNFGVQYPSLNNSDSFTLATEESRSRCECFKCNNKNCICITSSESFVQRRQSRRDSKQGKRHDMEFIKSSEPAKVFAKDDVKIPEIHDINSRGVSTTGTPSTEVTRSRNSSKQEQSQITSEESLHFEKCVCMCHAEPLPRCNSCHLLNTCKKCKCYRRIKCCLCKTSMRRNLALSSSCLCKKDKCQQCRCSAEKKQVCSICPCHIRPVETGSCSCKKIYQERSCQTEGKECRCCECSDPPRIDSELYRETKFMTEKRHVTESRKSFEVLCPSEKKYETEEKHPVEGKFPFQLKVPLEKKKQAEMKNAAQVKNELERRCPCKFKPVGVKELKEKVQCRCQSRNARKQSVEDHPRHYFLQVEETTEEEGSFESCGDRNSLEVITIKVPIRKFCKSSKNQSPHRIRRASKETEDVKMKYGNQILKQDECHCCEDCIGHKYSQNSERPRTSDDLCLTTQYETERKQYRVRDPCNCCSDCPGHRERQRPEFAMCDEYERKKNIKARSIDGLNENLRCCESCSGPDRESYKPLNYDYSDEQHFDECNCCSDCPGKGEMLHESPTPKISVYCPEGEESEYPSEMAESLVESENKLELPDDRQNMKCRNNSEKTKYKKPAQKTRKNNSPNKPCQPKAGKANNEEKNKCKNPDFYNYNKKEYMTKSELEREEKKKKPTRLTLQECLTVKRPDLYTRAECRRKFITEKTKDRAERHNKKLECLAKLLPQCDKPGTNADLKLFTSAQMKKQTRKFYKNLPEVTNKMAEEKKKMQFRTNKLMAEIFAKKLQLQTLKGCLNLSNSFTVMSTM